MLIRFVGSHKCAYIFILLLRKRKYKKKKEKKKETNARYPTTMIIAVILRLFLISHRDYILLDF